MQLDEGKRKRTREMRGSKFELFRRALDCIGNFNWDDVYQQKAWFTLYM